MTTPARLIKLAAFLVSHVIGGLSTGIFIWQATHFDALAAFFVSNNTDPVKYREMLNYGIYGATVFVIVAAGFVLFRRLRRLDDALERCIRGALSFSLLMFVPPLFERSAWRSNDLISITYMLLVSVPIFFIGRTVNPKPFGAYLKRALSIRICGMPAALAVMIAAYAAYFSYQTVLNHYQFRTHAYDLGIYENAFLNAYRGDAHLLSYGYTGAYFLFRISAIYYLWLPVYMLFPRTETLLITQSALVALAAFPLYFLGRKILRSEILGITVAAAYLLHPANQAANFFDIHERATLPLLVFAAFCFMEKKFLPGYYLFLFLSLCVKGDVGVALLPAVFYLYSRKGMKTHALISGAVCAAGYFGYQYLFVLTSNGRSVFDTVGSIYYGAYPGVKTPIELLKASVANPFYFMKTAFIYGKVLYAAKMTAPLWLLPFSWKWGALLMSYGFFLAAPATWAPLYDIEFQYVWYIVPFAFLALIYALRRIKQGQRALSLQAVRLGRSGSGLSGTAPPPRRPNAYHGVLAALVFSCLIMFWQYGAIPGNQYFRSGYFPVDFAYTPEDSARYTALQSVISVIPQQGTIAAPENVCPHLSGFRQVEILHTSAGGMDYVLRFNQADNGSKNYEARFDDGYYTELKANEYFQLLIKTTPSDV